MNRTMKAVLPAAVLALVGQAALAQGPGGGGFQMTPEMQAKMKAKKEGRRQQTRPDWAEVQLDVMRWVLRVKLSMNLRRFGGLLRWSSSRPIVERSRRDRFWGAVLEADGVLRGENWLGRLLMELREEVATLTIMAAEKVIKMKLDGKKEREMIADAIKQIK